MAVSVDYLTYEITIPQSDMTLISGTLYEYDVEDFGTELHLIQEAQSGIPHPTMFQRTAVVVIAGINYARAFEVIAPYTIKFEDGQYAVRLVGNNNNLFDEGIIVRNQVSVIPTNSAGLVIAETGVSGLTPAESAALLQIESDVTLIQADIATMQASVTNIEGDIVTIQTDQGTMAMDIGLLELDVDVLRKILQNRKSTNPVSGMMTVYDDDGTTPYLTAQIWEDVARTQPYRGRGIEDQGALA